MYLSASPIEPVRSLPPTAPALDRMAELFVTNRLNGYDTDLDDLRALDFTEAEIVTVSPKARKLADKRLADRDLQDDAASYDRPARVEKLANILLGLFDKDGDAWAVARRSGFSSRELTKLWPHVRTRTFEMAQQIGEAK